MLGKGKAFIFLLTLSCLVGPKLGFSKLVGLEQGGPYYLAQLVDIENLPDDIQMNSEDYLEPQYQESPIQMARIKSLRRKRNEKYHMALRRVTRNGIRSTPSNTQGMTRYSR